MKIFLFIALLGIASCNNSSNIIQEKKDSIDSSARAQKTIVDSAVSETRKQVDSISKTGKANIDSDANAKKKQLDSLHH